MNDSNFIDLIGRQEEIKILTDVMVLEYQIEDESYVLSLNAKFGEGKTTFLKIWQKHLENNNYKSIYIDSWKDSYIDNALVSLCYALHKSLSNNKKDNEEEKKAIIDTLKRISGYATIFSSQFITNKLGIDAIKAQEILNEKDNKLEDVADHEFKIFDLKKKLIGQLTKSLEAYIKKINTPLFIFIDELDRARPNYAIEFLETIRHIFTVKGLIFVLAIDELQLESAIQPIYGSKIKFGGYYKKFITNSYNLNQIYQGNEYDNTKADKFIKSYYYKYIKDADIKTCIGQDTRLEVIVNLAKTFKPSIRDIKYFFRIFLRYITVKKDITVYFGYIDIASFLILLSIYDEETSKPIYTKFSKGEVGINEGKKILEDLGIEEYIVKSVLLSLCYKESDAEAIRKIYNDETNGYQFFGKDCVGRREPIIVGIANSIENLRKLLG